MLNKISPSTKSWYFYLRLSSKRSKALIQIKIFSSRDLNVFVNILQQSCSVTIFKDLPADLNVILYGKATVAETGNELVEKLMLSAKIWIEKHHTQTKLEVTTLC